MTNIETATALLTAINFDRFAEIQALHAPDARFASFLGPNLNNAVAITDWHRKFQVDYADCNYTDVQVIEQDQQVALRAVIEAKGYDYRPFTQRVIEVMTIANDFVFDRRLYGMLRDIELDKPGTAAMNKALEYRGGSVNDTRKAAETLFAGLLGGDREAAAAVVDDKALFLDGVYGAAIGFESAAALFDATPRPAFGIPRITAIYASEHDAVVEISLDPARPRAAYWVRLVEGKVMVVEGYWMLREIGVDPHQNYGKARHLRQVILPI